jgi:glycosyltransferase involved in cell wall biosynthesis
MKNVWLINQYTSTPLLGGGGNRSFHIAKELTKKDYNVTLITASYSHVPKRNYEVENTFHFEKDSGINLVVVKNIVYDSGRSIKRILSMFIFWIKLYRLPIQKLKAPDYIIVSSISLLPILNAFYFKRKFKNKTKVILEIRDIWPLSLLELGNFSAYNPFVLFLAWVEKKGYQNADYLTSVLPMAYKHFEMVAGKKVKFKHISNGIHIESLKQNEPLSNTMFNQIPKGKFIVGYAGSLREANAMEYLIEAAKLTDREEILYCIVGEGYRKKELMEQAKDLENVSFLPPVPKVQVQDLLAQFDILYLGWRKSALYNFGISANKVFDYMYSGKPTLMSGLMDNNEIQLSNGGLLVSEENPEAIKNGVYQMMDMKESDFQAMGNRARQFVLENRSFESLSNKYASIFEELQPSAKKEMEHLNP